MFSDIVAISDTNWKDKLTTYNGTAITYDEMGNPLSYRDGMSFAWENGRILKSISTGEPNIRRLNPFRYRGYVYDNETGLYYLQSRYYDPITGRFLNADVYCDTQTGSPLSTNMFAYCENEPLMNVDIYGFSSVNLSKIKSNVFANWAKSIAKLWNDGYEKNS